MEAEPVVFIVDDDASFCKSPARLVRSVGLRAETFTSAHEFLQRHPFNGPSCLVLDARLPGMSGLSLQEVLADADDNIPIIFITAHGDISMSVQAMKSGAVDFLPKPIHDQDLLDAIQRALAKDVQVRRARAITQHIEQRLESLTPREHDVLSLVIAGLLNKHIAATMGTSERTVKAHRASLMQKMQVQSVAQLALVAERGG